MTEKLAYLVDILYHRALLSLFLALLLSVPALPFSPERVDGAPAPMIDKPAGNGPYQLGYTYQNMTFSTKAYTTQFKIYYPALTAGHNSSANTTNAPYPTVVWLPGTCCGPESYPELLQGMASWGMVVVTVGIKLEDFQHSGNTSDIEELLDHLEVENTTPASLLHTMMDKEAIGLAGHSSGAGMVLIDAPFVDRIKVVHTLAAAISNSTVDSLVPYWDKPIMCQVGIEDDEYINGCRRVYDKFSAPNSKIEIINSGHLGPFKDYLLVAFFLYYLDGRSEYWPLMYGQQAVDDVLSWNYDLWFKINSTHFFPPRVHAYSLKATTPMDQEVTLGGDIEGYFLPSHPQSGFTWDFTGDGNDDYQNVTDVNVTYTFTEPGNFTPILKYRLGRFSAKNVENLMVSVTNPPPVVVAGEDITINEDQEAQFDGSGSFDTPTDNSTLEFNWSFGDGTWGGLGSDPTASHIYKRMGIYTAMLTVKDQFDAVSFDQVKVTVLNVAPTASAGPDVVIDESKVVLFHGEADDTISDRGGLSFRWDFGDGSAPTPWTNTTDAEHSYTKKGVYTATFYVNDTDGSVTSDGLNVTVNNVAPSADIVLTDGRTRFEEDELITFQGFGEDSASDRDALMYRWDFGDGNGTIPSLDRVTSHAYGKAGFYIVSLNITDDDGAFILEQVSVEIVNLAPLAEVINPLGQVYIVEDDAVTFIGSGNDTPSDRDGLVTSWEIGDRIYYGDQATHVFNKTGTFGAIFRVVDQDGVVSTRTVAVHVFGIRPTLSATVEPQTIVLGQLVNYTAAVEATLTDRQSLKITWEFGDGTQATSANGSHMFKAAGTYTMKVLVVDDEDERDDLAFTITVLKPYVPPPPPKKEEGKDPLMLEALLVLLTVGGVALMALALTSGDPDAPSSVVKSPPKRKVGTGPAVTKKKSTKKKVKMKERK